jgi:hypothetical protein
VPGTPTPSQPRMGRQGARQAAYRRAANGPRVSVRAVVEAVTAELRRSGQVLTATDLARALRKDRIHVRADDVVFALQEEGGPSIAHVGQRPDKYRISQRVALDVPRRRLADPWQDWYIGAVQNLSDHAMDVLRLAVTVGGIELRGRCDVVVQRKKVEFRTSLRVVGTAMAAALATTGAKAISQRRGRLRPLSEEALPSIAVWAAATPRATGSRLLEIYRDALTLSPSRVKLELVVCPPAEADRRSREHSQLQRLRARPTGRRFPQVDCLRCGHPLSDPSSVRLGIGPECEKYFSTGFLRLARSRPESPMMWLRAKSQQVWLQEVRSDLLAM